MSNRPQKRRRLELAFVGHPEIAPTERHVRTAADQMRSVGARYHHEDIEMLDVLRHAAPFVPRIEAAL